MYKIPYPVEREDQEHLSWAFFTLYFLSDDICFKGQTQKTDNGLVR